MYDYILCASLKLLLCQNFGRPWSHKRTCKQRVCEWITTNVQPLNPIVQWHYNKLSRVDKNGIVPRKETVNVENIRLTHMHCYKWALSYNGKILNGILMIFIKFHQLPFQCYLFIIWWFYLNDIKGSTLLTLNLLFNIVTFELMLSQCSLGIRTKLKITNSCQEN